MMGLEALESTASWFPSSDRLTAAVQLAGEWNGAVLVECGHDVARRLTGRFLSLDPPPSVDDMVRDVLGEIANMVGGNLKCALTSGIRLSMPSVVDGSDYHVRICGAVLRDRLAFECSDGLFWTTIASEVPTQLTS
jgi:chemotaxis protein CheX